MDILNMYFYNDLIPLNSIRNLLSIRAFFLVLWKLFVFLRFLPNRLLCNPIWLIDAPSWSRDYRCDDNKMRHPLKVYLYILLRDEPAKAQLSKIWKVPVAITQALPSISLCLLFSSVRFELTWNRGHAGRSKIWNQKSSRRWLTSNAVLQLLV